MRKRFRIKSRSSGEEIGRTLFPGGLDLLKPMLVAIVSGIIGIIAYVLTPVNDMVNRWVWDEKAEMLLVAQNTLLREGDPISVDVILQPISPVPVSEGTVRVSYSKEIFRPSPESRLVFETPKLSSSKRITEKSIVLLADTAGKGTITAEFRTTTGLEVRKSIDVEVVEIGNQVYPTRRNFSGTWIIDLGRVHGTMTLHDRERLINGEYRLSNGQHGQIEGVRDGKTFRVTFYRGAIPSRWWIEGVFDLDTSTDLEVKGIASLQVAAPASPIGWKADGAPEPFHAVAKTR